MSKITDTEPAGGTSCATIADTVFSDKQDYIPPAKVRIQIQCFPWLYFISIQKIREIYVKWIQGGGGVNFEKFVSWPCVFSFAAHGPLCLCKQTQVSKL